MRSVLIRERKRIGIAPSMLMRDDRHALDNLTAGMIANWLNGVTATTFEHHLRLRRDQMALAARCYRSRVGGFPASVPHSD